MGSVEIGKCDICGKEATLERTYFKYNIPCECCGSKFNGRDVHFVMVRHCENCVPDVPKSIKPVLKDFIGGKDYQIEIKGMLPCEINGSFVIDHDLTEHHIGKKK